MSIATSLKDIETKVGNIETSLTNIKSALTEKDVTVPADTKLSGVPALIKAVETGSKMELVITAPDYEGQTLTATKGSKKLTATVTSGIARFQVDEEGIWVVSATDGNSINVTSDLSFEAELTKSKTFGVTITESESDSAKRVTYIGDAVGMSPVTVDSSTGKANYHGWDKEWVYKKFYPVMLTTDGNIAYKLNPDDYSKKLEGGNSDITNTNYNGNAMVCIEKFYTRFSMQGNSEVIEICDQKKEGFEAIGFIRENGTEADQIFVPMFMGSFDSNNRLRSLSGQTIKYSTSFTDFRTAAQKNGSGYDIETWAMNQIIQAVWLILMKNCNPKTAIGDGRNYNSGDSKTGLANTLGAISCDPTTKSVKFMHIEDFTSNYSSGMYRFEAGALAQSSKLYIKMRPPYSGTSISGYTQVSDHIQGSNYLDRMKCSNSFGRYGMSYTGSNSTYETAYWYTNTGSDIYISLRGSLCGVAGRVIAYTASFANRYYGAALSFLPPA